MKYFYVDTVYRFLNNLLIVHNTEIIDFHSEPPLIMQCLMSNFKFIGNSSNTCVSICSSVLINDPVLYLAFIPFILKGLSYLLVFVSASFVLKHLILSIYL